MSNADDHLATELAPRYRIERELGHGGMATVYLAHDLRHDRPVAVKVMRPEIAASLGAERFLQEIRIAARLRHPHILPVHDSGEAGGQLWYAMPYVEGESLRQRLERTGPLPLDEALRVATQVLGALAYAHANGVVHRDIKPENILLEGDQAVVADFGVARALSAAGDDRLTATGLALGTPTYMSPEQATAARDIDGRSDVYAMGCVLYEMLAGQPPFTGATAQQLLARHAIDAVPSLHTVRASVPADVESAVVRALAKAPVDRFATASDFAAALTAPREPGITPTALPARARSRRALALALAGTVVVAAAAVGLLVWRTRAPASLDPNLVAVVPFRVAGAAPELGYLREGMIDLVSARLTGDAGTRAVDPRSVMAAWRKRAPAESADLAEDAALDVARKLGAGQLLLGGIVGTPGRVALNASLLSIGSGRPRAEARVEGAADSLPQLVDRLIAQLITGGTAGATDLDGLVNRPLPALRLYLEARAAHRRARYDVATALYGRALDIDSTFALAGLRLADAAGWTAIPGAGRRGLQLAWAARDQLSARDRALLLAEVGPNYPATTPLVDALAAWERAVDLAPDEPDRWYELGDLYFHNAPYLGIESAWRRAADAFKRSAALDSNAASIGHLLEIAVIGGDSASVRRLGALYLASDSSGGLLGFYRWRIAMGAHDDSARAALRAQYDRLPLESLWRIMNHAVLDGRGLDDAEAAVTTVRAAGGRSSDWQRSKTYLHAFEVNRGRPLAALADTARPDDVEYGAHAALYERVLDALYGDGDAANAAAAARELADGAARASAADRGARATAHTDLCVSTLWQLSHGMSAGAAEAVARLRQRASDDAPEAVTTNVVCAALLDAKLADLTGAANAAETLERLDSLMRGGPGGTRNAVGFSLSPAYVRSTVGISPVGFEDFANLEVARLYERRGNSRAALAAVRRRFYAYYLTDYLARHLREEGRLAALTGDRAGATRAYRHYLALRSDAEPSLRPTIDSVRAELAALASAR